MNSVLQCLSNTRAVLEYVISNEYAGHINTSTSSMNGALIKGTSSSFQSRQPLYRFYLV